MDWQGLKVLVTGGAGQIGSHLVEALVARGAEVTVADNLWRGRKAYLIKNEKPLIDLERRFLEVDLAIYDNCLKAAEGQDLVYHLADVVAGINYVFGNQFSVYATNAVVDANMLRAAVQSRVPRYVYVGTACSYPAEKQSVLNPPPFKEDDVYPASPESSYGWSKLMGEYACQLAQSEGLIETGVLRFHNVYGPHCEMSPEKSQVIPALIRKALNYPQERFVIWGSGDQRRAFVYVADIVEALISVVEKAMNKGVIQIGPDESISIRQIAEHIASIAEKDIEIEFDPTKREGDIDRSADWSKAKQLLHWAPRTSIEEGLRQTFDWCKTQLTN